MSSSFKVCSSPSTVKVKFSSSIFFPLGLVHVMLGVPVITLTVQIRVYILPATLEPEAVISTMGSSEDRNLIKAS